MNTFSIQVDNGSYSVPTGDNNRVEIGHAKMAKRFVRCLLDDEIDVFFSELVGLKGLDVKSAAAKKIIACGTRIGDLLNTTEYFVYDNQIMFQAKVGMTIGDALGGADVPNILEDAGSNGATLQDVLNQVIIDIEDVVV